MNQEILLIIEYQAVLDASNEVSAEDLKNSFSVEIEEKLRNNPLQRSLQKLGELYIQRSQEEKNRIAFTQRLTKQQKAVPQQRAPSDMISIPKQNTKTSSITENIPSSPVIPQKRVHSDGSIGTTSTHTTPKKLTKAEATIQNIQNLIVADCCFKVFGSGRIRVNWPKGRRMYLCYDEYSSYEFHANTRTNPTSFACRLKDHRGDRDDRVKAVSDGALYLITDKPDNPVMLSRWSKQTAVLAFEVIELCSSVDSGQTIRS